MKLKEDLFTYSKDDDGKRINIFVNPTKEEIELIISRYNDYRFIADFKNKDLYVFGSEHLHISICPLLHIKYAPLDSDYMYGIAKEIKNGIAYGLENPFFDSIDEDNVKTRKFIFPYVIKVFEKDWSWLKSWFDRRVMNTWIEETKDTLMNYSSMKEKYKSSVKQHPYFFDIFINPSSKEYRECIEQGDGFDDPYIRFIIDTQKKNIYAFSINLLHSYATKELNIPYELSSHYIYGTAEVRDEGVYFMTSYELEDPSNYVKDEEDIQKIIDEIVATDFDWLAKYSWNLSRVYRYLDHVLKLTYRRNK